MKHLNLLSGIIIGVGFCLLISANSKTTPLNEDVPRYHLTFSDGGTGIVYDAVTGESKLVDWKSFKDIQNIKTILDRK